MPYLSKLEIDEYRHLRNIEIDCGEDGKHLILTGPNGSGKSTILTIIRNELHHQIFNHRSGPVWRQAPLESRVVNLESMVTNLESRVTNRKANETSLERDHFPSCRITFTGNSIPRKDTHSQSVLAYFDPYRKPDFIEPAGPKSHELSSNQFRLDTNISDLLLQVFVNQKTQQAYATVEDEHSTVEAINKWFDTMRATLSIIFDDPKLELIFERDKFLYRIRLGDHRIIDFNDLADGHKAALAIVADLLIRKDIIIQESGFLEPDGIVLIDEIETHLHLKLQEVIFPFLCNLFPKVQFIVATHSPAVIASVDNAIIYDLELKRQVNSSELQGIRYGTLMTSHFGISSDFDLQTTTKLEELKQLYRKERDENEEQKMRQLAEELSETSHALALEVLLDLKSSQLSHD
ncbi:AAA family ATPase [Leptolyngbya cf. ectocarpi LEGE 11479]|uniref:AAA family ATPase n=1 Tax=Leptolyngbya cf. ectocarpi LEGE 11479 TaxID=1828722 RepID=A0A928ZVN3_LEPEC|nr:AAA family ATPase [Leptolyngbya ectocarpi]MBE9068205.1 AAA family ATPase [Leptolyngbya cf. ectocarpi LEGE 11479]